jgi:hypothetical protein
MCCCCYIAAVAGGGGDSNLASGTAVFWLAFVVFVRVVI